MLNQTDRESNRLNGNRRWHSSHASVQLATQRWLMDRKSILQLSSNIKHLNATDRCTNIDVSRWTARLTRFLYIMNIMKWWRACQRQRARARTHTHTYTSTETKTHKHTPARRISTNTIYQHYHFSVGINQAKENSQRDIKSLKWEETEDGGKDADRETLHTL